ncbi:hypothetical protein [Halorubrum sp. AS12]|uniref:hypothetical protein n=1 Tax=Halorubrum sp. AS12 TaxID=3409687 RepID=UPI003DA6F8D6
MTTVAGVVGLTFASGAFTQVEADRTFDVGLASNDASSQLVIEENSDLESGAIEQGTDGAFTINASNVAPDAHTTYGEFETITDATSLERGVFVVRNENDTGEDIDVTFEIGFEANPDAMVELAVIDPSEDSVSVADTSGAGVTISNVPSTEGETTDDDAEIACGLLVDTTVGATDQTLNVTLTVEAVRSTTTT